MNTSSIYSKEWCNTLFENKNTAYGAYQLRMHSEQFTLKGMAAAYIFLAATLSVIFYLQAPQIKKASAQVLSQEYLFQNSDVEFEVPKQELAAASPASSHSPKHEMVSPVIVDDRAKDDKKDDDDDSNDNALNDLKGNDEGNGSSGAGGGNGGHQSPGTELPIDSSANMVVRVPEVMPEFPGGIEALTKFLGTRVKYPRELLQENIQGTVYLSFVIDKVGNVKDITVLRGIYESKKFEHEAIAAVESMPQWKPGMQNNKPVNVMYTLPIIFRTR